MVDMTVTTTENPNALTDENVHDIIDTLNENVKSSENLSNIVAFPSNNGVEEHEPEEGYEKKVDVTMDLETGRTIASPKEDKQKEASDIFEDMGDSLADIDFDNFEVTPEDIKKTVQEDSSIYGDLEDIKEETILDLLNLVNKSRAGEQIKYKELPLEIKDYVDTYLAKEMNVYPDEHSNSTNQIRNMIADDLITQYVTTLSMDKYTQQFNEGLENIYHAVGEELSSYVKDYDKNKIEYLEKICKDIDDEEKKQRVSQVLDSIYDAYKLTRMKDVSYRIKKFDLEKPNRVFDQVMVKYRNNKYHIFELHMITNILNKHLKQNGYEEDGTIFMLAYCKFCLNYKPEVPEEHAFVYYVLYNIALLDIYKSQEYDDFAPEFLKNIVDIIHHMRY